MIREELFLIALVLTIVTETLVLFGLLRLVFRQDGAKIKNTRIIFAGIFTSFATIPYLWFVIPRFVDARFYIWIGEAIVILLETVILNQILEIKITKTLLISLVCNIVSFLVGILFFYIF